MSNAHSRSLHPRLISTTRIKQVSTGVFHIDVRGLALTTGRHAIEVSDRSLRDGKRPLSAILPGSREDARFEIGEIQIENGEATMVLFGPPTFKPATLVF